MAGLTGNVSLTDYCSAKFAAVGLEESLRLELDFDGYNGMHSTIVCPFFMNTRMFKGVVSNIIPILRVEYVSKVIISAVLSNKEMVVIPQYFYLLIAIKSVLPIKAYYRAFSVLGFNHSMDKFRGRKNK